LLILTVLFRVLVTAVTYTLNSTVKISNGHLYPEQHCQNQQRSPIPWTILSKSATVTHTLNNTVKIGNGHQYPEQHCQNQQRSPIPWTALSKCSRYRWSLLILTVLFRE
jgi:hypothetical protein